jgi:hypothetical protein
MSQTVLSEVNQRTAEETVRYSFGRNPLDVLKYALPIIRNYYPKAEVCPLDTKHGREPKLVIAEPGMETVNIPITRMSSKDFYSMLLTPNAKTIDFSYKDLWYSEQGHLIFSMDENWIRVAHSETDDPLRKFQISCVFAYEDFLIKKRPYVKIEVSPDIEENKVSLAQLTEALKMA